MRIKVDEDLPRAVATLLEEAGHQAVTVLDEHLGGASDETLWPVVQREERFLITADKGFGDIRRYPPGSQVTPAGIRAHRPHGGRMEGRTNA